VAENYWHYPASHADINKAGVLKIQSASRAG